MKVIWSPFFFSFFFLDFSIDAPPSFKPAKKYSDVSGLLVSIITSDYSIKCKISVKSVETNGPAWSRLRPECLGSLERSLFQKARHRILTSFFS